MMHDARHSAAQRIGVRVSGRRQQIGLSAEQSLGPSHAICVPSHRWSRLTHESPVMVEQQTCEETSHTAPQKTTPALPSSRGGEAVEDGGGVSVDPTFSGCIAPPQLATNRRMVISRALIVRTSVGAGSASARRRGTASSCK
jgi:hypothetical protein